MSITFGWETFEANLDSRDRNAGGDPRIAGITFIGNGITVQPVFRVDLPASGQWQIGLAMGDAAGGNPQTNYVIVKDSTTALITFAPLSTSGSQVGDAAGNLWSTAAWPGSNVMVTKTFASTIFRLVLGPSVGDANSSCIQHIRLTQAATTTATPKIIWFN